MIASIDPGVSTGWALWKEDGTLVASGTLVGEQALYEWLFQQKEIQVYVVEEFKLYPWMVKQQSWSEFETVEAIGAIKLVAYKRGVDVVKQRADIKTIAYKLSGIAVPTVKAKSHRYDAIVHGYHYFYRKGILKGPIA